MLRPEVRDFAKLMEQELAANDHKGGWQHDSVAALFRRMAEEMSELADALAKQTDVATVQSEAADVANFAMMIADNYRRQAVAGT